MLNFQYYTHKFHEADFWRFFIADINLSADPEIFHDYMQPTFTISLCHIGSMMTHRIPGLHRESESLRHDISGRLGRSGYILRPRSQYLLRLENGV